jgi:hypothetical protein
MTSPECRVEDSSDECIYLLSFIYVAVNHGERKLQTNEGIRVHRSVGYVAY